MHTHAHVASVSWSFFPKRVPRPCMTYCFSLVFLNLQRPDTALNACMHPEDECTVCRADRYSISNIQKTSYLTQNSTPISKTFAGRRRRVHLSLRSAWEHPCLGNSFAWFGVCHYALHTCISFAMSRVFVDRYFPLAGTTNFPFNPCLCYHPSVVLIGHVTDISTPSSCATFHTHACPQSSDAMTLSGNKLQVSHSEARALPIVRDP